MQAYIACVYVCMHSTHTNTHKHTPEQEMAEADQLQALEDSQPVVVWCGGKDMFNKVNVCVRVCVGGGGRVPTSQFH